MAEARHQVQRGIVPRERIDDALRLLHLNLLEHGAPAQQLSDWLWAMHWFPDLKWREEITRLADTLPPEWRTGTFCDPQILLQFPHTGPEPEISFHLDQEPDWADGRRYLRIVGIPLSPWTADNGGLLVQDGDGVVAVEVEPGDAVMLPPDLPHSGGVNRTGAIRYAVYFRYLEDSA